jgi:hypothetical protein
MRGVYEMKIIRILEIILTEQTKKTQILYESSVASQDKNLTDKDAIIMAEVGHKNPLLFTFETKKITGTRKTNLSNL